MLASAPLGEIRFVLPAGRGRAAREVHQQLYAQRVTLPDGRRSTLEAAVELIDWYRARWEIEMLFLALKEACRVEALHRQADPPWSKR